MTVAPILPSPVAEPPAAALLARGVCRALDHLGYASLVEFPLANHRRADVLALGRGGELVIVEIKTSVADFRADQKWSSYREYADRLYFAVASRFPNALIPEECGLMVADAFGAAVLREACATPLAAGRRRAVTLRFAQIAAARLRRSLDPEALRLDDR
ncbi:MAG TPA: MmcB family DNA repair protein [Stellaceae bacterium]|nr:MmcB family DNA repair protein [Stellaceae bacterium]